MVSQTKPHCPVVGIGASAGGLEALKAFFNLLLPDSGAAFVVIQHLDPNHKSMTADILSRSTTMPTVEVTDGTAIEANHVYVIPPNHYLKIEDHTLVLSDALRRKGLRMPIDAFFWSLAEQRQHAAVAIILSGTGSDGSLGLRAVKGNGGLVIVQDPASAQYDGMPRSAIATGMADRVCAIENMPRELCEYLRHPYIKQPPIDEDHDQQSLEIEGDKLRFILSLLQVRTGLDFRAYKSGTLERRINRRMGLHRIDTLDEYLKFLKQHPEEPTALIQDLMIGVTAFFRDPEAFAVLEAEAINPLIASKTNDDPIRVWIPGCTTGEEAYSIAMLLAEKLKSADKHCPLQIFATDIDDNAVAIARAGLYPENIATNLSSQRLQNFFHKEDHHYRVNKALRETLTFATQNLISDPPFSRLDLISCRNLLIYLKPDIQKKVLQAFHFSLRSQGYLFLGHSETANQPDGLFKPVDKKWRLFQRRNNSHITAEINIPLSATRRVSSDNLRPPPTHANDQSRWTELAQQLLLREYAPAAVLVDNRYQILLFFGPTALYLSQPSGAPTKDILALAIPELRARLREALKKATRTKQTVTTDDIHLTRESLKVVAKITVRPLISRHLEEPLWLITFDEHAEPLPTAPLPLPSGQDETLIKQLEQELNATREELQINLEEQETANEELQAANEEVMSVNEELQSTNEELETTKEELQSMNEELTTANNELKDKVDELTQTNDDLDNLLGSTDIATLFLDAEMRIGLFTEASQHLFNLIKTDVGRPVSDITPKFTGNRSLLSDAKLVLSKLIPIEDEVVTEDNEYYLRRVLPYRTRDNRIGGVVITFIDITQRKLIEQKTQHLAAIMRDSNDAVTTMDLNGKITTWNRGAEKIYGWTEKQALTMTLQDMVPLSERLEIQRLIKRIANGEVIESFESQHLTNDGRTLNIWFTITPLFDRDHRVSAIATTERDITQRKQIEKCLLDAKNQAEASHAMKSRFLAMASHDLRQPLHSLALLNSSFEKITDDPEARKILDIQRQSLDRMSHLLNSLLDISKLESGTTTVTPKIVEIAPFLNNIVAEFNNEAVNKGLKLKVEANKVSAYTDPNLLSQLIQNLVSNAICYTNGGAITISCIRDRDRLRMAVSDTGIGIPKEKIQYIFNDYFRTETKAMASGGNLGLGLAIVRRIANLLDTKIDVESEVGKGTTFSFFVPVARNKTLNKKRPDGADKKNPPQQKNTDSILLIDDDAVVLESTTMLLKLDGFTVLPAALPPEAYKLLEQTTPDIIVTDYHLQHADTGVDLVRKARQQCRAVIPAIVITGDTTHLPDKLDMENMRVLTKPLTEKKLTETIAEMLQNTVTSE